MANWPPSNQIAASGQSEQPTMSFGRAGTQGAAGSIVANAVGNNAASSGYTFGNSQLVTRIEVNCRNTDLAREPTYRLENTTTLDTWDFVFSGGRDTWTGEIEIGTGPFLLRLQSVINGADIREPVITVYTKDA